MLIHSQFPVTHTVTLTFSSSLTLSITTPSYIRGSFWRPDPHVRIDLQGCQGHGPRAGLRHQGGTSGGHAQGGGLLMVRLVEVGGSACQPLFFGPRPLDRPTARCDAFQVEEERRVGRHVGHGGISLLLRGISAAADHAHCEGSAGRRERGTSGIGVIRHQGESQWCEIQTEVHNFLPQVASAIAESGEQSSHPEAMSPVPGPAVLRHKSQTAIALTPAARSKSRLQLDSIAPADSADCNHRGRGCGLTPSPSAPLPAGSGISFLATAGARRLTTMKDPPALKRSRTYREISLLRIYQVGWRTLHHVPSCRAELIASSGAASRWPASWILTDEH